MLKGDYPNSEIIRVQVIDEFLKDARKGKLTAEGLVNLTNAVSEGLLLEITFKRAIKKGGY